MERMHLMFKYSKTKMELTVSCDVSSGGCQDNIIAELLSGVAVTCVGALSSTKKKQRFVIFVPWLFIRLTRAGRLVS